MVYKISRW